MEDGTVQNAMAFVFFNAAMIGGRRCLPQTPHRVRRHVAREDAGRPPARAEAIAVPWPGQALSRHILGRLRLPSVFHDRLTVPRARLRTKKTEHNVLRHFLAD